MKPLPIAVLCAVLAVLASALTHLVLSPAAEAAPAAAAPPASAADAGALRALAAQVERLSSDLRALSDRVGENALAGSRSPEHDLEALVRRVVAEELPALAA